MFRRRKPDQPIPDETEDVLYSATSETDVAVSAANAQAERPEALTIDETITFETREDPPTLISVDDLPSVRRVRPWVWWATGGLVLILGGGAASWFLLPIKQVEVTGNSHLSVADVKRLAGLRPNMGWLYYGQRQARGLMTSPWVLSAEVTRKFPDKVTVAITERKPFLKSVRPSGEVDAVAEDGKLLPGAKNIDQLPSVSGWGPERLADAVLVTRALSRYTVQSVTYTPTGLTVKTAGATVWSGDLKSLVKYAGSISMYPNQNINIYPWGVSVQQ